jgi:hypothetical protein
LSIFASIWSIEIRQTIYTLGMHSRTERKTFNSALLDILREGTMAKLIESGMKRSHVLVTFEATMVAR